MCAVNYLSVVSDPQMENSTLAALAFYWFLKYAMLFHTSGPLLLLPFVILHSFLALFMTGNHIFA